MNDSTVIVNGDDVDYSTYNDRELLERIATQNDQIVCLLSQGIAALQSFQSGPMGAMVGRFFGSGNGAK